MINERMVCDYLNRYLFENVWNEPASEYRTNIVLRQASASPVCGYWRAPYTMYELPVPKTMFYIFSLPISDFLVEVDITDKWTTLADINLQNAIDYQIYDKNGVWLWRNGIYIRSSMTDNQALVAIPENLLTRSGVSMKDNSIFMTRYYDSDENKDLKSEYFYVQDNSVRYRIWEMCNHQTSFSKVIVNGKLVTPVDVGAIPTGAYVERIVDGNIRFTKRIDNRVASEYRTYTCHNATKVIVHPDKVMNKDLNMFTWNTCDIFVRSAHDPYGKGYFVPKCYNGSKLFQLTHCDLSFDASLLDAYKTLLGTSDLIIEVVYRRHLSDNVLIRDVNYIDLLYVHDDQTILDFMQNKGPVTFEFWTAQVLETSVYGKSMLDVPDAEDPVETKLDFYVKAFGYNNAIAIACDHIGKRVLRAEDRAIFSFNSPVLFAAGAIFTIVYRDGVKLPRSQVVTGARNGSYFTVTVKDGDGKLHTATATEEYTFEFYEQPSLYVKTIENVSATSAVFNAGSENIRVYVKRTSGSIKDIHGISETWDTWEPVSNFGTVVGQDDGSILVTLDASLYGTTVLVIPDEGIYLADSKTFNVAYSDYTILASNPLMLDYNTPLLGDYELMVYLNGKYLVPDLDYIRVDHKVSNAYAYTEVVVQNVTYLKDTNNVLEVYAVMGENRLKHRGYIQNYQVNDLGEIPFWFDNLSMLFVEGMAISSVESMFGQLFVKSTGHRNGAPYCTRTIVPRGAIKVFDKYATDDDTERMRRLREYFISISPEELELDLVPYEHSIYSIYLDSIVRDYMSKTNDVRKLNITLYADPTQFMSQFNDYAWLKTLDAVFSGQDLRYVDLFPIYHTGSVDTSEELNTLRHLFKVALPVDKIKYQSGYKS